MWLFDETGFWLILAGCFVGLCALIGYAAILGGADLDPPEMEGTEVRDDRPRTL